MSTAVWLSTNVVNISVPLAGIVELRRMIFDIAPPIVSMPSESGVTSSSSMSRLPVTRMCGLDRRRRAATTSSGFRSACGVRPNSSSHRPAHQRDARRAADQHDLVDLRRLAARRPRAPAGTGRACDRRRAGSAPRTRRARVGAEERRGRRQRRDPSIADLGLLALGQVPLGAWMTAWRTACSRLGRRPMQADAASRRARSATQQLVDVVAAQVRVAVGRQHLEDAVLDAEDRDVEGAAAEVVDGDRARACAGRGRRPSDAAVGSLMIRSTSRPAIRPASRVAVRCASLKYAGTVMTARSTSKSNSPCSWKYSSARRFSSRRMNAEISGGVNSRSPRPIRTTPPASPRRPEREQRGLAAHVLGAAPHEPLDRVDGAQRVGRAGAAAPRGRRRRVPPASTDTIDGSRPSPDCRRE